ncbi:hypothetical protein SH2C18_28310 [Clostridium sediminicola]|uniref:hypothetical protein n=1 Tax=Clostridium sediminicola TaxID=3114879 RepID=UPI0031F20FF3
MTENNNEIRLTMSKGKYITAIVICIIIIGFGTVFFLEKDFNSNIIPAIIGVGIGLYLSIFPRMKKIKKSGIDVDKYFDFKFEMMMNFIIFFIFVLGTVAFRKIFLKVLSILLVIFGVLLLVDSTINYFKKRPMVIINDYGIKFYFSIFALKVDMLKWEEVKEVFKYEDTNGKAIGILPKNMKNILGNRIWVKILFVGNPKIFTIHQRQSSMDIDDLYIEIKTRMI